MGWCGVSSFIIKWVNFFTLGVSFCMLGMGIWLSTKNGDCAKFLTLPVLIVGGFVCIISFLGFLGAGKDLAWVLCLYLVIMFFLLLGLVLVTAFAFIVINEGAGRVINGQGFKEYSLADYSGLIQRLFNNPHIWKHLRDCVINSDYCAEIAREYDSTADLESAKLNSIQSGCCRPPAECNFPMTNVIYYDLTSRHVALPQPTPTSKPNSLRVTVQAAMTNVTEPPPHGVLFPVHPALTNLTEQPVSQFGPSGIFDATVLRTTVADDAPYQVYDDPDCTTFENDPRTMCYECNSCKAGVAQYLKKDWRLVAMINIAVLLFLVALYTAGCSARNNVLQAQYTKKRRQREVETENPDQFRRNWRSFRSDRRFSHDEELGPEPQVRCWQIRALGEPEDLILQRTFCPMQVPWSTPLTLYQSRKRPGSTKRHGKKKMPRLEGQNMVSGKRPRTGEEQLEQSLILFGAARRITTVLNYEDSKTREEKLLQQLPPTSAANTTSMSDVSLALQYDIPSTSDWDTTTEGVQTPPREIQVERERSQENETERRPKSSIGKAGTSTEAEPKTIPSKKTQASHEENPNAAPATVRGPFRALWRHKPMLEPEVLHIHVSASEGRLVTTDENVQHDSVQTQLKEPEIPGTFARDSEIITVTKCDEVPELSLQEELTASEELRVRARDSETRKVSTGDCVPEERLHTGFKEPTDIHIHVSDTEKRKLSWGDDVSGESVQGKLNKLMGTHMHLKDSDRQIVSRNDDTSEGNVQGDLQQSGRLHIHVAESERKVISEGDNGPEELKATDKVVHVAESERKTISEGDNGPELRVHVSESARSLVYRGDDKRDGNVQQDLQESKGLQIHVRECERRIVSRDADGREESVEEELKESVDLHLCAKDSEKSPISTGDNISTGSVQIQLNKGSRETRIQVRDPERRIVSPGTIVSESSQSALTDAKESRGLTFHERDRSDDPDRYNRTDKIKEEEGSKEDEDQRKTTPSANSHFSEPKLSSAISPISESVKQKKVKSAGEESHKRGVSQYVFDPPKITRPKLPNQGEPPPKPEQERSKILLEERGSLSQLEKMPIKDSARKIRPKSTDKRKSNSERKTQKKFMDRPSKSRQETQAKLEKKPLKKPLKEPLVSSLLEPQQKSVQVRQPRPKHENRVPRASSSFEPQRKSKHKKPPQASFLDEARQKSGEEPRWKLNEKPQSSSSKRSPQPKSIYDHRSELVTAPPNRPSHDPQLKVEGRSPRRKYVEEARPKSKHDHRSELGTAPRNSSFQDPELRVEGRDPRSKYVEESRPKSIYDHRSKHVAAPPPGTMREDRFKSVRETQPTLVKEVRPNSGDESRSRLVTAHRPKSAEDPWPSLARETRPKAVEEPRPTVVRDQRPKYVEEYRLKPIDEELHEHTSERGESSTRQKKRKDSKTQRLKDLIDMICGNSI